MDVQDALATTRLLTLTGAGGCGKTRLALEVATAARGRFPGGAWWLELATLSDPDLLESALADVLDVRPLPGQSALDAAVAYVAPRSALIVLDNCEHLLEGAARVAEALLRGCPDVTVVATSRAPLGVLGETDWRVPSLSLPEDRASVSAAALEGSDAVRLFLERATKVRPNLRASDENAPALLAICRALDGIPLAIELAAARVRLLSVEQIAAGLEGDPFRLLTDRGRAAAVRHRTLHASVEWSHDLLTETERMLFRRLGVFLGGFTLEAAEDVCSGEGLEREQVLDLLASLVERSLVQADERGPAVRYRLLEAVRHYAVSRLDDAGELRALRDRHRDAYLALAERVEPELVGPREAELLELLDGEEANLTAAIEWAAATVPELALRLSTALTMWWWPRGKYSQAEAAYRRALEAGGLAHSSLRARALWGRALLLGFSYDFEAAVPVAEQALAEAEAVGDETTMARALYVIGLSQTFTDPVGSRAPLGRSRELAEASGDELWLAASIQTLAYSYLHQEDHAKIRALLEDARPIVERLGHGEALAYRWFGLGYTHYATGEHDTCRGLLERAIAASRSFGDPAPEAFAAAYLALTDADGGDPARGLERLWPARERALARGAGLALPWLEVAIAQVQAVLGRLESSRSALEALIDSGALWPLHALAWGEVVLAEVLRQQRESPEEAEWHAQRALEIAEGIGNPWHGARAGQVLGRLAAARSDWGEAERLHHAALAAIADGGFRLGLPDSLEALAEVAAGLESLEEAARLLGAAERARTELGFSPWAVQRDELTALSDAIRQALGGESFEAARAAGSVLNPDEAVAWVRRGRGSRKRPSGGWEALTPTEAEVVRHAAAGLRNAEIGERMFISPGTVKTHLAHAYAKLGLRNRSELAAAAARRRDDDRA